MARALWHTARKDPELRHDAPRQTGTAMCIQRMQEDISYDRTFDSRLDGA
jgi:hypothetical protein